jgi:(S)-2-hydroxy-acid oxidase
VELALNILLDEFKLCMALAGCKSVDEIGKQHLAIMGMDGRLSRL